MVQLLHCDAHVFSVLPHTNFNHSIQINSVRRVMELFCFDTYISIFKWVELCPGRAWSTSDDMLGPVVVCLVLHPSNPALHLAIQAGVSSCLGRLTFVCYY